MANFFRLAMLMMFCVITSSGLKRMYKTQLNECNGERQACKQQLDSWGKYEAKLQDDLKTQKDKFEICNKVNYELKKTNAEYHSFIESLSMDKHAELILIELDNMFTEDNVDYRSISKLENTLNQMTEKVNLIKEHIEETINPKKEHFKSWNLNQMLNWVLRLESGRFDKYIDSLRAGFESDGINKGKYLPKITAADLRNDPFKIISFMDRKDLASYFQSLSQDETHDMDDGIPLKHEI
eukprot:543342_1